MSCKSPAVNTASLLVALFLGVYASKLGAVTVQSSTIASGTFQLNDLVSYNVILEGTIPVAEGPYAYIVYVEGTDIYGNQTYMEAARGTATGLRGQTTTPGPPPVTEAATTFPIQGTWRVPNDGTLFNVTTGYRLVVAVYPTAAFPATLADFNAPLLTSASAAAININVVPDIAINSPGAVYAAGSYRGNDILRFTTSWRNDSVGDTPRQSRPLRPQTADNYIVNLRLSTDPDYASSNAQANDDFNLMRLLLNGDLGSLLPSGTTDYRKITVTGTPGAIEPYGISLPAPAVGPIPETERDYTPQPDDNFLDVGESVDFTAEYLIPANYTGRYFVTSRVEMTNPDFDTSANNTFVSNAANKIEILSGPSPLIEPASAVSDQDGSYVQGGDAASDFGSASENGDLIAFSSGARNLLVPPDTAAAAVALFGPNVDLTSQQVLESTLGPVVRASLTTGNQIFIRYRQTREILLASRDANGVQANADCFNPAISADGRWVAYDSTCNNLLPVNTGNRSMIYIFDANSGSTVLVSKTLSGAAANGSSYNPSLSASGRFVSFESIATDLDPPRFTANVVGGRVTSYTPIRSGAGYNPALPPAVTITGGGGTGARARANVGPDGNVLSLTVLAQGSGYTSAPTVTVAAPEQFFPPEAGLRQVYLHDRDLDADGVYDEAGNTATYLVSQNYDGGLGPLAIANNLSYAPVVNLDDSAESIAANGGMFVAYASYGTNLPNSTGRGMVYRALVDVESQLGVVGLVAVSVNDQDLPPLGNNPYSLEPAINGDGSQVAFTSNGVNLVYNPITLAYDGDTNDVPDIFVRNFRKPLFVSGNGAVQRVSVSQERVATGIITFAAPPGAPGNIPDNNPIPDIGDSITIGDGVVSKTFVFTTVGGGDNVPVGATVQATRDNLIAVINTSGLNIIAEPTTPPNDNPPGTAYLAGIYLKNTTPGVIGNVPFVLNSATFNPLTTIGMTGGGTQATDAPVAVQGVPFGSNQPSIDRSGRFVAFRTIAENLDVHVATDSNTFPSTPLITGELVRPLIFPTSNVYLHDRLADGDSAKAFDLGGNYLTKRVSVNIFGYPTLIFGTQPTGVEANTSANSSSPALSGNGRFVIFSSDSEGSGGLVFGPNNLTPLDNTKFRDVYVHDRLTVGSNPPQPTTLPTVTVLSPADGLRVTPNTDLSISASARASAGKTISSVQFFVNNTSIGTLTAEPFSVTYRVPTTGEYVIRALATDSKGLTKDAFVKVISERPPAGAPFVQMTQPIAGLNFVTGSKLFLNAQATATAPATIRDESVRLSINGIDSTDPVGKLGDTYGVLYSPTEPFIVDTYRASATDSSNVSNQSAPLFSFLTLALSPLPVVEVLPFSPAEQVNEGEVVQLVAEVFFPQTGYNDGRIPERVEFYVNKVYVGEGTAGAVLPNGRTLYTFNWQVRPEYVNAASGDGTQTYEVYARAVALNWQTNTEDNNVIEVYGSVVDGPTPLTVYYVPDDAPPGSNAAFVTDTFEKLFLREPTYDEFSYYLNLLNGGLSQSQVVVQMAESEDFNAHQQILFGYYARMGLKPTSKTNASDPTSVSNLLNLMTNGTNTTLLPSAMSVGVTNVSDLGPSPYGATVGQALVAERLIGTITNPWTNSVWPKNLDNASFMNWMRRSFNQPYLPQSLPTNVTAASMGDSGLLLGTIASFPTTNASKLSRFGYSYAFLSAFYESMPNANITTANNLRTTLANFPALVKGAAVSYLLSPTGQWPTNASGAINTNAVLSTNLVASNLPPQITSTNRITATVGVAYTNFYRITATGVGAAPGFGATGLPPGLSLSNSTNGVIFGTPTLEGDSTMLVSATNAAGAGQLEVSVSILPPAPQLAPANVSGTNNTPFPAYKFPVTPTNTATKYGLSGTLPAELFFDATNGMIFGTPFITNVFTNPLTYNLTMFATNRAGSASNSLVLTILPKLSEFAKFTAKHSLSGALAAMQADPDGDGFVNSAEFAFGLRPDHAEFRIPFETQSIGNSIQLRWFRPTNAAEVSYSVVTATNLAGTWTPVSGATPLPTGAAGAPEGYEEVSVTVQKPAGVAAFYRIKAEVQAAD